MQIQPNQHEKNLAIYIHWPFCKSKCPYCDFNSHVAKQIDIRDWLEAYKKVIDGYQHILQNKKITSIFFGGGTPSLMPPELVGSIIEQLSKYANVTNDTEITLEANPTSSEADKFAGFKLAGVNRLSLGVQAFDEERLKFLGREHNLLEAQKAIKLAEQYFDNFSFDLIYATPGQDLSAWERELGEAMHFAANHISLYQLTIEKGTQFYSMYNKKAFTLPDEDTATDLYIVTGEILAKYGLQRYEISNYAKPGFASKHNLTYWLYNDYLGIGPGAHSRISFNDNSWQMQAFNHVYNPNNWQALALNNADILQNYTILSPQDILTEILMMGLRLEQGITQDRINKFFGKRIDEVIDRTKILELEGRKLLTYSNDGLKLTVQGYLLLSQILLEL